MPGAATAAVKTGISNASLSAKVGDLGQIEELYINNNPTNKQGKPINFVLPNTTSPQNGTQHQWMGELIFSYRTAANGQFPDNRDGFVEVDTNKTLAAGRSTQVSTINPVNPLYKQDRISRRQEGRSQLYWTEPEFYRPAGNEGLRCEIRF
ncbi:hypothetical protein Q0F98_39165 [Paenibacillus amylolyticus]|nr:hypothetical protein Q0F98_39165 [Paenibacillus amylolyticus]